MSKEYERNLSIIIPHYNTPDLLQKLIDSIPHIEDIQIIVVDDRSDMHVDKLAELQVKYKDHVEFYRNDDLPKGAGTCRNIGLRHADGKWILFADADDFFVDGMYETVSAYFDSEFDEIFFKPTSIYFDTRELSDRHITFEKYINDYLENPTRENILKLKISLSTPCSKLIRHKLIRHYNIWFDEVLHFNDMMFSVKVGHYSKKIAVSEKVIYCIVRTTGSLTTQIGWDAYEIRLWEYLKVCDFLKKHYSLKDLKTMHYTCLGMLYRAVKSHYGIKKYILIIKVFYKHGIPLFSLGQINMDSLLQLVREMKAKRMNSKYMVRTFFL
ncbi:MAG: glycosyltransferase family 2 protein [Lachnospiraceae bacterium]|nr:glycosyltransferase family 2 protein [Lachnospiraceae bacterium]